MTDDETREVFAELRRVGVDLGRPPGLALGTGFAEGEFLAWLGTLPDALGHDGFVERLTGRVNEAQPNAAPAASVDEPARPQRLWPTLEHLDAGIDVLLREWDPLGARLGTLSREDVADVAYQALTGALGGGPPDGIESQIADMLRHAEEADFGVNPSPLEQRRYLARRLIQVVVDHPGPAHEDLWEKRTGTSNVVMLGPRGDELPPLDPTAPCTECGAIGTVAVVMRDVEPLVSRYCPSCWSSARGRYLPDFSHPVKDADRSTREGMIAGLDRMYDAMEMHAREQPRYVASAMWDDTFPFLRASLGSGGFESPADREGYLRSLADEVVQLAPTMYGPMPPDIEAFVREHGASDA